MKKRYLIFVIIGMVSAVILIQVWSNGPSTGTVTQANQNVKGVATPEFRPKPIQNNYFSAQIPERFTERSAKTNSPLYLQQLYGEDVKTTESIFGSQLAVTIGKLPELGLKDLSAVTIRKADQKYKILSENETMYEFESTGYMYEISSFIKNNDTYAAFVLSGPATKKDQLLNEMRLLESSIVWR